MNPSERMRQRERYLQEEKLGFAGAIREMKDEETKQSAFEKQLYACAPEIRDPERELRRGYYAKTLYAQRLEGEALKLEDKMRQQENYDLLFEKLQQFDKEQDEKREAEWHKKKEYYKALTNQLNDVTSEHTRKKEDDQKYKNMIDEIVETIKQEEIQDLMEKTEKVKLYQSEIGHFLHSREVHREGEKERKQKEEENIKNYVVKKEQQQAEQKQSKAEQDKAKASIVAKAIDRIMKEQFRQEELEELRKELYDEEMAEDVRRKDLEELARRHKQMMELRAAAEANKPESNHRLRQAGSTSKAHWTQAQLNTFLEQFGNKDRPQGCKDAQLRNKHKLYPCLRNCGQVFTTRKNEKEHYNMGKQTCSNFIYNRTDLEVPSLTPTPPLSTVRQAAPVSMNIQQVIKMYNVKGAAVSLRKFTF